MMRFIGIIILLIISVLVGLQLQQDPGYLLIEIRHWRIEMTLAVALISIIILFIVLHSFLSLMKWLGSLPSRYKAWRNRRRLHLAKDSTRRGLIEFSEGDWSAAESHLTKGLANTDTPLLNYLTAAKAAQELGNIKLRDEYLQEAQQSIPEASLAVDLTQAQLQLDNQQWTQALTTLNHLKTIAPNHPYVLKLLMQLYQAVNDWPEFLKLLPRLQKSKLISQQEQDRLEKESYLHLITDLTFSSKTSQELIDFVNSMPKKLRYDADLIHPYCQFLIHHQVYSLAESTLRRALKHKFDEKLILLYSDFLDNKKQLPFAESFIKEHGDSAALYLSLGKLSKASLLWGKAKTYLEKSLAIEENHSTYTELGGLFDILGEQEQALEAYRLGALSL